jgi:hypothetical protein
MSGSRMVLGKGVPGSGFRKTERKVSGFRVQVSGGAGSAAGRLRRVELSGLLRDWKRPSEWKPALVFPET